MFSFKSSNLIGIDLGSHAIKVMRATKRGSSYRIEAMGAMKVGAGEGTTPKPSEVLRRVLALKKIRPGRAATAIGAPQLSSVTLSLPRMPEEDLASAVSWDMRKSLKIPSDELVTDYVVSADGAKEDVNKTSVIAFGARKSDINRIFTVCREASVDLRVVDAVPTALLAAFDINNEWDRGASYAILDIGYRNSTLVVVGDRELKFVRVLHFGGGNLTNALSTALGLEESEAESAKLSINLKETLYAHQGAKGSRKSSKDASSDAEMNVRVIKETLDILTNDVLLSFDYFHANYRGEQIRKLYISGGTAAMTGIDEIFSANTGVPTFVLNPLASMQTTKGLDRGEMGAIVPLMTVATGLATRKGP